MAWKPTPFKQVCPKCHWSKVVAPNSDVVFLKTDQPSQACPNCGCDELESVSLNWIEKLAQSLK